MKLEIAKIVGAVTEKGWGQVHTFAPEEKEKIANRGQLLAVISLSGLVGEEQIASGGKELISRLHEEYYGDLASKPFAQLGKSVTRVFQETKSEAQIEITAASLVGEFLYLAIVGKGQVVLKRQGETVTLLVGKPDSVETASGRVEAGDIYLLGTGKFLEIVPQGVIRAALATGLAQQAAEMLAPAVCGREDEGLAAAIVAGVEKLTVFPKRLQIKNKLSRLIKKISIPKKPTRSTKSLFTVAVILFLLLGISVFLGARQRKNLNQETKIRQVLEQAKAKKEEGQVILTLNSAKARTLLLEAQQILDGVDKETVSPELQKLKNDLAASLVSVLKEYQVEPKVFLDLGLIKDAASGIDLAFSDSQLLILDQANLAVYSLDFDKKSAIVAGGKDLTGAQQIAGFLPKVFILAENGIVQTDKNTRAQSLVIKTDKDWGKTADLGIFGGNLYLLDQKTIWQYLASESGFGSKRNWLKTDADFSQAVGMAIDGAIWVLKSDGTIQKFVRGVKENFSITGLAQPLDNPKAIYTDADQKFLYVLEPTRLVVLNKIGEYQEQYLWKDIDHSSLAVSEKDKKIMLLATNKIYEIDLR